MSVRVPNGTPVTVVSGNRLGKVVESKLSATKVERYRVKYDGSNVREWFYRRDFRVNT